MKAAFLFLALVSLVSAQQYDLLLKGGHVIDPKNSLSAVRDVAISGGKVAAVETSIDPSKAKRTVDAKGLYVTPGIIDIHVHVYAGTGKKGAYNGDNSVYPDGFTFRSGVTTVVDAGSSGWKNFPDFKDRVIDRSKTRVLSFVNIVGEGMGGRVEQVTADMDPKATAAIIAKYPETIVGVKTAHFSAPEWTAVDRAVEAGTLAKVPVMVDFGTFRDERPWSELVTKRLRPGDIYTHFYLPWVPMFDDHGRVNQFVIEGRKRGVIYDVGHGGGSFVFRHAVNSIRQGMLPDSISTDLHIGSMNSGLKDMANLMSKFLVMGMSLDKVIAASTWNPARQIKREDLGHLTPGAIADIAVMRVENGDFGYVDSYGAKFSGKQRLTAEITFKGGRMVWDLNGRTRDNWDKIGKDYLPQGDESWDATLTSVRSRKK